MRAIRREVPGLKVMVPHEGRERLLVEIVRAYKVNTGKNPPAVKIVLPPTSAGPPSTGASR